MTYGSYSLLRLEHAAMRARSHRFTALLTDRGRPDVPQRVATVGRPLDEIQQ